MGSMAGKRGFEPLLLEPESRVLPLDDFPMIRMICENSILSQIGLIGKMCRKKYMKNYVWNVVKKTVGVILIVGGIFGLFLPFLQGIAMILAGAVLLENKFIIRKVRAFLAYLKRKKK